MVERCFARLKQFRAIATRFDKLAARYHAGLHLASLILWHRESVTQPRRVSTAGWMLISAAAKTGGTLRVQDMIAYDGVATFLLLIVVWQMRRRLTLRSRGVEVIARCFDRDWRGKGGPQFLLSYTTPDGVKRTHSAGEDHVPAGTREGDSVAVLYDPTSPGRAETALASRKPFWKHYDMAGLVGVALGIVLMVHVL